MPIEPVRPHCPKCRGKPARDQRKLSEAEHDRLTGNAWEAVSARFRIAFVCEICAAIYLYKDGFSTYITRLRD